MKKRYFFIDESGDSTFYANRKKLLVDNTGFQPMLNLGMISVTDKTNLRNSVSLFMKNIKDDPLYNSIYSVSDPNWYLHAKDDHPEIRAKFFEFIRSLNGFKSFIVIGRKKLNLFKNKHNNNEKEFYFDLVYHLLKDRLNREDEDYHIFLSSRQKNTQLYLEDAIKRAIQRDNNLRINPLKISYKFDIVRSQDTPELSITDYLLWGLNRYIIKNEDRFYKALVDKYNLIIDLYDTDKYRNGTNNSNYYHSNNIFSLDKAAEFKFDGYK